MNLSIEILDRVTAEDANDLNKIWPQQRLDDWLTWFTAERKLGVARFNTRLLGAVKISLVEDQGFLQDILVREVTRRRGVGTYLLQEVERHFGQITHWHMAEQGPTVPCNVQHRTLQHGELNSFMSACGFHWQQGEWLK